MSIVESDRADQVVAPAGRVRWRIGLLLAAGVLVNYVDRINLSVAAPQIQTEFGLSSVQLGWLFSSFFWLYAVLQIPCGMLLDRFGVALTLRVSTLLWSVSSALAIFSTGFGSLLAARVVLGVAEAPGYPGCAKAVGLWFPRGERSLATAVFDAASRLANVIGVPFVAVFVVNWGWRAGFAATAVLSLLNFVAFTRFYRDPSRHPKLGAAERQVMLGGGAAPEGRNPRKPEAAMVRYLLGKRKTWGVALGFASYGYVFYLFLTWLPNYLVQEMHLSIIRSAGYAAIPWLCAMVVELIVGGWLVDRLVRAGKSEDWVRKGVLVGGFVFGLCVIGAVFTHEPGWAILWISLSISGLSCVAPVAWTLPPLIAPAGAGGTLTGIANFLSNTAGLAAPVITGYIVGATGSFALAFAAAGVAMLIGIFAFTVLLGRLGPVPEPG